MSSHFTYTNIANQRKLKFKGMFMKPKSYSDIKKEYEIALGGPFEYNEATVAEVFNARREVLQNRKTTAFRTWTIIFIIVALGAFIVYKAIV